MAQSRNRPATLDPEVMWDALVSHDRSYDGVFVCAVSSTGIYCRPTCPAKRPHRSKVNFYDSRNRPEAPVTAPACDATRTAPRPMPTSWQPPVALSTAKLRNQNLRRSSGMSAGP